MEQFQFLDSDKPILIYFTLTEITAHSSFNATFKSISWHQPVLGNRGKTSLFKEPAYGPECIYKLSSNQQSLGHMPTMTSAIP